MAGAAKALKLPLLSRFSEFKFKEPHVAGGDGGGGGGREATYRDRKENVLIYQQKVAVHRPDQGPGCWTDHEGIEVVAGEPGRARPLGQRCLGLGGAVLGGGWSGVGGGGRLWLDTFC